MNGIKVIKLQAEEIEEKGIELWPIWTKEISKFPWTYEGKEECLIIEGKIIISSNTQHLEINSGDFVVFENGFECVWDIKEAVKKYYKFHE